MRESSLPLLRRLFVQRAPPFGHAGSAAAVLTLTLTLALTPSLTLALALALALALTLTPDPNPKVGESGANAPGENLLAAQGASLTLTLT